MTETPPPTVVAIPVLQSEMQTVNHAFTGRWIDVDLDNQMVYAYEDDLVVGEFLVSTGTAAHPTVKGQFHIYLKFRYDDMAGPGYYLRDVPYVMYFYRGYGIHGTYWHDNFGTPMSHGCVNMRTDEAAWLYDFASMGTLVNVH
jgi:lipoprotein-anchoring transpeptidase ErfK/SrfK